MIIHQLGTVDLTYNRSRVTGLSASNNTLKIVAHTRGRSSDNPNINSDTCLRNKGPRAKETHQSASISESSSKEQGYIPPLALAGTPELYEL